MAKTRKAPRTSRALQSGGASVETGAHFWSGSKGRWAGERLLAAVKAGRPMAPCELRTLDTLRKDEWKVLDDALIMEAAIRLRGVADLIAAGLTRPVANSLGKTVLEYEKVNDMAPAQVSMDGRARTEDDRLEFTLASLPIPIIHKDFNLNLRTLSASRERGEPLDTMQTRVAGRLVAERSEDLLFNGYSANFGGLPIYGYTTHPDRNTLDFATPGEGWGAAGKTGEEILTDVLNMMTEMETDRMYGPYRIYVPRGYDVALAKDFKANSDKTIRSRLLEIESISGITLVDSLAADNVVMVQMTTDVVVLVQGERLQTVQWDIEGGFQINFKAFQIQVPLIRSDVQGRSGIVHLRAA